jgi:hypothetical protein
MDQSEVSQPPLAEKGIFKDNFKKVVQAFEPVLIINRTCYIGAGDKTTNLYLCKCPYPGYVGPNEKYDHQ